MESDPNLVLVERADGVCSVVLNRPQAMNAITAAMVAQLNQALDDAQADDSVRALVLTGAGRAFCAGADLKESRKRTEAATPQQAQEASAAFASSLARLLKRLEEFPKPVIAAVNGVTVAGGLEILLCCDIAIAAEEATIGDGHSNFALMPGGGATARLPRRIGDSMAKYLMFTGEALPASRFLACGMISKIVPGAALRAEAHKLAAHIAAKSPLLLREMKRLLRDSVTVSKEEALARELEANRAYANSQDRLEGLAAFAEKRKPRFTGR
ncbi:MAG: enoyl-CoA hydratase-related protein [Burkholderiaceae bacterium]|nr:enoyl-CoA hydratase-related protein [Burkholderiaceae bacterium]